MVDNKIESCLNSELLIQHWLNLLLCTGYALPIAAAVALIAAVAWAWRTRKLKKDIITLRRDPERTDGLGLRVLDITKCGHIQLDMSCTC